MAEGYSVYVGNALNGNYGKNERRGQIFYLISYISSSGQGTFKFWDGSWKTVKLWEGAANGHFGGYWEGNSEYRLHPISDMNAHVYGSKWKNSRGGSNYTLRYPGRMKTFTGDTLGMTLKAGTKIHIGTNVGKTGGISDKRLQGIEISGYYKANGTYVSLKNSVYRFLNEPTGGYYPGSYNINTM